MVTWDSNAGSFITKHLSTGMTGWYLSICKETGLPQVNDYAVHVAM